MTLAWFALALAAATQTAGGTPTVVPAPTAPSEEQRVAQASRLGHLIYAFDRAASVSTDALVDRVGKAQLTGIGGYVVEPGAPRSLRVTYYRGSGAAAQAFYSADVQDGRVVHQQLLEPPVALTPAQAMLARAREAAAQRAATAGYRPCTPRPFNSVALPVGKDGAIAVYLLTAQVDSQTYVVGGNYRVIVATDGQIAAERPYGVRCMSLSVPKLPAGATLVGVVINHLLDPTPTELHVFASYALRRPLFVATPDKRLWRVQGDVIAPVVAQ